MSDKEWVQIRDQAGKGAWNTGGGTALPAPINPGYVLVSRITGIMGTRRFVEQAVKWTEMKNAPVEDRFRLVSDNGPRYLAHAFEDHFWTLTIQHIRRSPQQLSEVLKPDR